MEGVHEISKKRISTSRKSNWENPRKQGAGVRPHLVFGLLLFRCLLRKLNSKTELEGRRMKDIIQAGL